jgi:CubicO group peptidase (beta-lactamase class C family)
MRAKRITIVVILLIFLGGYLYLNPLLPIITGYAAKNLSSGVMVAERSQESLEATDLNFSFIQYVDNHIDYENKLVSSRFLWHKSEAVLTEGEGCVLLKEFEPEDVLQRPYFIPHAPDFSPDTVDWPYGERISDTIPPSVNIEKLKGVLDNIFIDSVPLKGNFAVAIIHKGQLIAERYRDGFSDKHRFLSWSMAKSFTNALTGIMVKKGLLDVNETPGFIEWENDNRKDITINHLLQMKSGLEWNEDYGNNSDVNIMLHKIGDMGSFAINKPLAHIPGETWYYSSGTSNILSLLIRKRIDNDSLYYTLPYDELFYKIGMYSAVFETDASGTYVGSSYIYATMRDYARFGLFFLNNGKWNGEQILPENWVDYTRTVAEGSDGKYGAQFWLNAGGRYPDVPKDMYSCNGHDGQFIFIIPSKDLVVVRTGFSKGDDFDRNIFLSEIIECIE